MLSPVSENPYHHRSWAAAVRHWKRQRGRLQCARCGGVISRAPGRGPDRLDVGHIIGVASARGAGWTIEEMNAISNTQPEHQKCNREAGGRAGVAARAAQLDPRPATTREW